MNDASGAGGDPPGGLQQLTALTAGFLENERDVRVAVINAADAGHSVQEIVEATGLPLSLVESWTGAVPSEPGPWAHEGSDTPSDELGEQRQLRTGTLSQRVEAAEAKNLRAERDEDAPS